MKRYAVHPCTLARLRIRFRHEEEPLDHGCVRFGLQETVLVPDRLVDLGDLIDLQGDPAFGGGAGGLP